MPVINSVADMKDEAATWRRELHQHPQTNYEEVFASDFVAAKLKSWGIPFEREWAKTGIIATIEGRKTSSGKAIGLRADMDALDIVEKSGVAHASKFPGKMHACGHDGHTSILLATAKYLNDTKNFDGKVHLIFQPAEEGGGGAIKMVEEGIFKDYAMDAVFGLHNWPYLETGKIAMRKGPLMASADEIEIVITGKGGHAAMPHTTIDPIVVAAQIVTALQSIVSRNVDPVDQGVVTIANFNAGTGADNVIGDTAKLGGTIRAFRPETREFLHKRVEEITTQIAQAFMAKAVVTIHKGYDPTINSDAETEIAASAARDIVGAANVDINIAPCMGAEDFGAFLMKKPGAYIFVGQKVPEKDSPHNFGLHSAFYDFNDDMLPIGASYFARLVENYLK